MIPRNAISCGRAAILGYAALAVATATAAVQVPTFTISTIAGTNVAGYKGDSGAATAAELNDPRGIVTDPAGNVYFCDRENNVVRKIDTHGIITTVAGTGIAGYNGDNIPGTKAALYIPWRVTIDPAGNLYIADAGNDRIRKLAPTGIITTVVGNGSPGYWGMADRRPAPRCEFQSRPNWMRSGTCSSPIQAITSFVG